MNIVSIRNGMRLFAATSSVVLTVGAAAAFAAGGSATGTNDTTGADSVNKNITTVHHTQTVHVTRTAHVSTPVSVSVDTGHQTVKHNTTVGDVTNGDTMVMGAIHNDVNSSGMDVLGTMDSSSNSTDFFNGTTGAHSSNINEFYSTSHSTTTLLSSATLLNAISANLASGHNYVTENTSVGDVTGGNVGFSFGVANTANSGSPVVTLGASSSTTNAMGTNTLTGFQSENLNKTTVNNSTSLTDTRNASISNTFGVHANTGGNSVNGNTTVGNVSSGNVAVDLMVSNTAN